MGFCEIDKYAAAAYKAMHDTTKEVYFEDITRVNADDIPDFDLFVEGFPCQPFSLAGLRRGFEDARGTLFYHIARILQSRRPKAVLLENVPGLLSHDDGNTYRTILGILSDLGYSVEWRVFNSACFGVPQQRHRVYIVGCLDSECTGKILSFKSIAGKSPYQLIGGPQGQRVYAVSGTAVTQCAGSGGWGGKTGLYFIDLNEETKITDLARCVLARYDAGVTNHKGVSSGVFVENNVISNEKSIISFTDSRGNPHSGRIRKLMPIECWRLQGFTDEQFNTVKALGICDGQLYKMAGNAVTVPVVAAVGKALKKIFEKQEDTNDTN